MAEEKVKKQDLKATMEEREKALTVAMETEVKRFNELNEARAQSGNIVNELNARLREVRELLQEPK